MKITLDGFEATRVSSADVMESMPHISDIRIEQLENIIRVWVKSPTTGTPFLCAAAITTSRAGTN